MPVIIRPPLNLCSYDKQVYHASDHLMSLIEAREKPVVGTSYKELKDLVQNIRDGRYFDTSKQDQEAKSDEIDGKILFKMTTSRRV